ncbi:MAG: hypothetical protein ABF714_02680 [Novacetimonas hansenii]|uniref:hypothetical protein n=1 Tax=Novacetimonas hansenii TaxID=436 RepID=UPI0039ECB505
MRGLADIARNSLGHGPDGHGTPGRDVRGISIAPYPSQSHPCGHPCHNAIRAAAWMAVWHDEVGAVFVVVYGMVLRRLRT